MTDDRAEAGGSSRLAGWLGCLALIALPVWLFRDVLFGPKVFFTFDLLTYVETKSAEVLRAFSAGRLPLWSPHIGCGVPFLAELDNGVLSPFNLLLLAGPRRWLELASPLWCALAGLGMFGFLREWRLRLPACVVGAASFGCSGLLVFYFQNPPYLQSAIYIPLLLLCWHRALARESLGWLAGAAAAVALMLFAGDVHNVYFTLAVVFGYGFIVPGRRPGWWVPLLAYAGLGVLSAALSAVQLLPTLELTGQAPRALDLDVATQYATHPGRLVELLLPFGFGLDLPGDGYRGGFLHRPELPLPWTRSIYVGLLPLLLLPAAFVTRRTRSLALLMAAAGLVAALGACADHLPVYAWLYQLLPLFDRLRVPSKLWILVTLAQAVLIALGFDRVLRDRRVTLPVVLGALLALAGGAAVVRSGLPEPVRPTSVMAALAGPGLSGPAWHLLLTAVALTAGLLAVRRRSIAALLLVAIHLLDLAGSNGRVARYFGAAAVAPSAPVPVAAAILADQPDRLVPPRLFHDERLVEGRGYRPPPGLTAAEQRKLWDRLSLDWNHGMLWDLQYLSGYTVLQDSRPLTLRQLLRRHPEALAVVVPRLGAEYLLLPSAAPTPLGTRHLGDFEGGAVRLFRADDPAPRAYLARAGRSVTEPTAVLQALGQPQFDRHRQVLLEVAPGDVPFPGVASAAPLGELLLAEYRAGRVVVDVDVPEPRYLVLAEAPYTGWRVTVDGAPRPSHRANYLHQAVAIRPGERRVEFRYLPTSLVRGAWVSGVAWLAVALWLMAALWRRRSGRVRLNEAGMRLAETDRTAKMESDATRR